MRSQENNLLNKVIEVLLVTDSPEFLNESRKESLRDLGLDGYDGFLETPEGLEILYSITQNEIFLQDANIDELKNKIYRRFYNNFRYTKEVEGENDVSFGFLAPVLLGLGSFIISSDLKQGVKIFKSKNSVLDVIVGGDAFITSDYQSHLKRNSQGVDVRAQVGTELFAPEDVKVIDIYGDDSSVGGLQMIIENLEGTRRWGLAHLELVSLKKGDVVKYGELMAKSGASGTSKKGNKYAPHLHLTLKVKDDEGNFIDVDPEGFEIEYEDDLVVGENILKNLGKSINNPMSIKSNVFDWEGAEDKTGTFVKFKSDYYGVRAGMKILYNYYDKYGIDTIDKIVERFVTGEDNNDMVKYKKQLSMLTGYGVKEKLDIASEDVLTNLTRNIAFMESGSELDEGFVRQLYRDLYGPDILNMESKKDYTFNIKSDEFFEGNKRNK